MYCVFCGKEIPAGSRFCTNCGTAQEPAEPVVTEPVYEPEVPAYEPPVEPVAPEVPAWEPAPAPEVPAWEPPAPAAPVWEPTPVAPVTVNVAPAAPVVQRPAFQLKENRSLAKMFFLGLITFGIYNLVVMAHICEDINIVASRYDGKRTKHLMWVSVLGGLTLFIYPLVWIHGLCNRIGAELKRRDISYKFSASTFWLWNVLGSLILVGPFIYLHKFMKAMNLICKDYNIRG